MLLIFLLSALIMFLFEAFILLRVYQRSSYLQKVSLIVAPLFVIVGLGITIWFQRIFQITPNVINPFILFIVLMLIELPFSIYGYEIKPNASIPERMIVAGSFGVTSVIIAQGILTLF